MAPATYPPTAAEIRSAVRRSGACWCSGLRVMNASSQRPPLPSMKMLRIRMVIPANSEFTTPRPMSESTPAAPPILLGSFAACSCSWPVMS
jgi:hypothetical protein